MNFTEMEMFVRQAMLTSLAAGLLLIGGHAASAASATPPALTAGLFTSYSLTTGAKTISWATCGSVTGSEGCYDAGEIGNFSHVCSMIQDDERQTGATTVAQDVYIVDEKREAAELVIYKYVKTDIVTPPFATTGFILVKKGSVPMKIGAKPCYMAADKNFLFVATGDSLSADKVSKQTFAFASIGGASNNPTVGSISADERGWVSVNFSGGGFALFAPDGSGNEGGGGYALLVNTAVGTQPPAP